MSKTSFYSNDELSELGLKSYGKSVLISRYARLYSPQNIEIGDNVRIDDFCILSGKIKLGSNIHISAYVALYGSQGIELEDFTGISAKSVIYSAVDDFSGDYLCGPVHPDNSTHISGGLVIIKRYSQIGVNCVIMPNLVIGEGVAVGACSFVNKSLNDWGIYCGTPAKYLKERSKGLLKFVD